MNNYPKNISAGVIGYLVVNTLACIVANFDSGSSIAKNLVDACIACTLFGWAMWIPYLLYPLALFGVVFSILRLMKRQVHPVVVSSSLIFFAVGMVVAQYWLDVFRRGIEPWHMVVITVVSCLLGFGFSWVWSGVKSSDDYPGE